MPDSHIYLTCRECASCHCHDCVMQEREVKRQAVQALVDDRDELKEQVARLEEQRDEALGLAALSRGDANHYEQRAVDLRAALEKYGRHSAQCYNPCAAVCDCVCGLAEALKGAE